MYHKREEKMPNMPGWMRNSYIEMHRTVVESYEEYTEISTSERTVTYNKRANFAKTESSSASYTSGTYNAGTSSKNYSGTSKSKKSQEAGAGSSSTSTSADKDSENAEKKATGANKDSENAEKKATSANKDSENAEKKAIGANKDSENAEKKATSADNHNADYSLAYVRKRYGFDLECICVHLNTLLAKSALATGYLPLKEDNVFDKLQDGVLLCAMTNALQKDTADESAVVRGASLKGSDGETWIMQNLNLALRCLEILGVSTIGLNSRNAFQAGTLLYVGLMVQIIRRATLGKMSVLHNENLAYIVDNWRDPDEIAALKSMREEAVLKEWVNYQLRKAGTDKQLKNFTTSLTDSEVIARLLHAVAPEAKRASLKSVADVLSVKDLVLRATLVVDNAKKLGIENTITPEHIARADKGEGNMMQSTRLYTINVAFIAQIYASYPNIEVPSQKVDPGFSENLTKSLRRSASEETLMLWLNSFGVDPTVRFLDTDLRNGLVLLQVWEIISPGCVKWSNVESGEVKLPKRKFIWLANCTEVMRCATVHGIKVNCQASDIASGDIKNTLALVFLMMRLHSQIHRKRMCGGKISDLNDEGLIKWVNARMKEFGSSFQLADMNDTKLKSTNALGYLGERVLVEHDRFSGAIHGAGTASMAGSSGAKSVGKTVTSTGGQKNQNAATKHPQGKWLFPSVEPVSEAQLNAYSRTTLNMFRRCGVSIFAMRLSPEVDTALYRDVLLQLNGICSEGC